MTRFDEQKIYEQEIKKIKITLDKERKKFKDSLLKQGISNDRIIELKIGRERYTGYGSYFISEIIEALIMKLKEEIFLERK